MTDANELITLACKVQNLGPKVILHWSQDLREIEQITVLEAARPMAKYPMSPIAAAERMRAILAERHAMEAA